MCSSDLFVYAGTLIAAAWVARTQLPKRMGHPKHDATVSANQEPQMPLRAAVELREYWTALTLNFTTGMTTFGMRSALLPLYVVEALHHGPSLVSFGFLAASAVQAACLIPSGTITDGTGRKPALLIGSVALTMGMVALLVDRKSTRLNSSHT